MCFEWRKNTFRHKKTLCKNPLWIHAKKFLPKNFSSEHLLTFSTLKTPIIKRLNLMRIRDQRALLQTLFVFIFLELRASVLKCKQWRQKSYDTFYVKTAVTILSNTSCSWRSDSFGFMENFLLQIICNVKINLNKSIFWHKLPWSKIV